jgi:hypothetical protein
VYRFRPTEVSSKFLKIFQKSYNALVYNNNMTYFFGRLTSSLRSSGVISETAG